MPQRSSFRNPTLPYLERSRDAKKHAYRDVKARIAKAAPVLGGRFYTCDYMHGQNSWVDLLFLGNQRPIYFNVAMCTTRSAYKERVFDEAMNRADRLVAESQNDWLIGTYKDPATGNYVTPARDPRRYPEFGGLSRYEWINAQQKVIADEKCLSVHEGWKLRYDYHEGIGLHVKLDVPYITVDVVHAFMDRFLPNPNRFRSPIPISFGAEDIEYWGLESNAIAEPWEWQSLTKRES